jgi:DNA mismatch repair protein MutS2
MDARSLHALELPKILACLAGFAVSEAGRRACLALRPMSSCADIRRESDMFTQGRLWMERSGARLAPFENIEGLLHGVRAPATAPDPDDLFILRRILIQAKSLATSLAAGSPGNEPALWPLWAERCRALPMPEQTLAALLRCLSDDGLLRDEASPELALARGELRRLHQQCARRVKQYTLEHAIAHYLQDSFVTLSSDRYVLPLKADFKGRLQGIVHEYSQTGETCYFEPMFLVELNNRLQELKREERRAERAVFLFLGDLIRAEYDGITALYAFLADLDLLFARVALAVSYDGRMLEFAPDRGIALYDARHPLLALAASRREEEGAASARRAVASTLELLPGQRALIISGGNAGGKTVCLKTIGLTALMGLCALPVPVGAGSGLPLLAGVHAFIGDEQSLEDHVSTFTAQITHLGRIWPSVGTDSLLLLDEFGAGTDPAQGSALAQAVIERLMEKGAYVAAATHFPGLKAYALSGNGARAASVLFDPGTKKPLFRLAYDQVGASQALEVAREHGLPEEVLTLADRCLSSFGEDGAAVIARLNALAAAREEELARLAEERAALERQRRSLREGFAKERDALVAGIRTEIVRLLADHKAERLSRRQTVKELARLRGAALNAGDAPEGGGPQAADPAALTPRRRVLHIPWKRAGLIVEVDERKRRARLDVGGVSLWADMADLALEHEGSAPAGATSAARFRGAKSPVFGPAAARGAHGDEPASPAAGAFSPAPLRLDVRGLRAEEALSEVQKALDSAIAGDRESLEIVHGRGTGALRREIHAFLKRLPSAAFRQAPEGQGGDGMTIVELK